MTLILKKGSYAKPYRVKDQEGKTKLLKLFAYSKLDRTQFNDKGDIENIKMLKQFMHQNIVYLKTA